MNIEIEQLAKELHLAGKEAVERGLVVNKSANSFLSWEDITEEAREGRRVQARYLLDKFEIHAR